MDHSIFSLEIEDVRRLVEKNEVSVCVVGLGRIGLPTALMFARSGLMTVGVDIDAGLVTRLSSGNFLSRTSRALRISSDRWQVTADLGRRQA